MQWTLKLHAFQNPHKAWCPASIPPFTYEFTLQDKQQERGRYKMDWGSTEQTLQLLRAADWNHNDSEQE